MKSLNKLVLFSKVILLLTTLLFISCGGSDDGTGSAIDNTPSNLVINAEIVGADAINVNGNGSGEVNFIVTANNATSYKILIGSETINSSTGIFSYTFNQMGTNNYTVYVSAYNGTKFISGNKSIVVFKSAGLVWSDEFNTDGLPNSSKWGYDTGGGGWGNNELQNYTNRIENAVVQNGVLKIITIKENYGGNQYTSARLKSQGKFSFKYGRVDIRAKLPSPGGTWPALWMLGDNISSLGWPACGEIDIMEHLGNSPNVIHGSLHSPNNYGGNSNTGSTTISNATTEFHVYSLDWNASEIKFYVDNVLFYSFPNTGSLPFNNNFFLIINNAMGGWGGTIDPNFTTSTFEVDYVRVYQ